MSSYYRNAGAIKMTPDLEDEIQSLKEEVEIGLDVVDELTIEVMNKQMELEDKLSVLNLLQALG